MYVCTYIRAYIKGLGWGVGGVHAPSFKCTWYSLPLSVTACDLIKFPSSTCIHIIPRAMTPRGMQP